MNLADKKPVPLSAKDAADHLSRLDNPWEILGWKKIRKEFVFKNFQGAMAFVNKVAELSEREGHHPDILVHGWNKVRFELSTHAIGGLSENDFIMAAKINKLV